MKKIPLTQGKFALVDDADFVEVSKHKWSAAKNRRITYAARQMRLFSGGRRQKIQYLHQFIRPDLTRIDHQDGDGLNCQRENLRPATHRQNLWGYRSPKVNTTSKYRGVSWEKSRRKWLVQICICEGRIFLGRFRDEIEAAKAYDAAARRYHGEFACLNFP